MFNTHRLIGSSLFVLFLFSTALAQEKRAPIDTLREPVPAAPLVTAAATAKRVRFVSPGTVVQLRLEVYNEAGQKLFDTELHGGNVLDWHLQDGAGQGLPAGSYACVLTIKSLSGRLSRRVGLVTVNDEKAAIEAAGVAQLSLAQQQAISPVGGPVEGNAAFTVLQESEAEAMTAVTHDGTDGQLTRTRGALSFRVGDFFAGTELEQMRLTEDGNLGIGTAKPQARLDVAGTIRAEKGIEFADGTVQTTGLSGRKDKDGNLVPNVAGTGTQGRIAKWTDNSGTLGNSVVTEATSGKLGIGTASPNYEITLFGNDVGLQLISSVTGTTANDGFRFGISSVNNAFLWNAEATDMYFGTSATERMRIKATGNVGIGTTSPSSVLHVVGSQPPAVSSGNGTDAAPVLQVIGGKGGNADIGGKGADVLIQAGNAGDSANGGTRGSGGSITLQPGLSGLGGPPDSRSNGNLFLAPSDGGQYGGNVLVGPTNTDPDNHFFKLHVAGNAAGLLRVAKSTTGGTVASFGSNGDFKIDANGVDAGKFVVKESGNVGIGTAGPAAKLDVAGDARVASNLAVDTSTLVVDATNDRVGIGTNAPSKKLQVFDSSNTGLRVENNIGGGTVGSFGSNGDFQIDAPFIFGGRFTVKDTSGNVGIGQPAPVDKLQVAGDIRVGTGTTGCVKDADGTVLTGTCSSDARFKRDITPFPKLLDQLVRLQPAHFYWRATEYPEKAFGSSRSFGLVAQDVEQVLPELVTEDEKGFKAVRYNKLPLLMLQGLKELKADNDSLRRENDALKRRLDKQESRLRRLETKLGK